MKLRLANDPMELKDIIALNPLELAYVGDSVYEVFIRSYILTNHKDSKMNELHKLTVSYVKAESQSLMIKGIMDSLSEEELRIFKRGRNAKSGSMPKSSSAVNYRMATGFEALIGYLYLSNNKERLNFVLSESLNIYEENESNEK